MEGASLSAEGVAPTAAEKRLHTLQKYAPHAASALASVLSAAEEQCTGRAQDCLTLLGIDNVKDAEKVLLHLILRAWTVTGDARPPSAATEASQRIETLNGVLTRAEATAALYALTTSVVKALTTQPHGACESLDLHMIACTRQNVTTVHDDDGMMRIELGDTTATHAAVHQRQGTRHAQTLVQTWRVLAELYKALLRGKKLTSRELWYLLKPNELFTAADPALVYARIMDVCAMLSLRCGGVCPREALGVLTSSKGIMTGPIELCAGDTSARVTLRDLIYRVPGDAEMCGSLTIVNAAHAARCVLVVEKDAVFSWLGKDPLLKSRLQPVLVTASGYPDLATRKLVARLVDELKLPAFCLTDWNPHGLAIMLVYKYGSARMALERCYCRTLRWLGVLSTDVADVDDHDRIPYSQNDHTVLDGLMQRAEVNTDGPLMLEVTEMKSLEQKVDIEALHGGFGTVQLRDLVIAKVEHGLAEAQSGSPPPSVVTLPRATADDSSRAMDEDDSSRAMDEDDSSRAMDEDDSSLATHEVQDGTPY